MEVRTRFGSFFDVLVLAALTFVALAVFLTVQIGNLLLGVGLALPTTALLFYAVSLWRRRGIASQAARENGRWHLHNLMLQPHAIALRTAAEQVAKAHGIEALRAQGDFVMGVQDEREVAIALLQRPLASQVGSDVLLRIYHAASAERVIVMSTAEFTAEAAIFARQLRSPQIALLGSSALEPLLRDLPGDDSAHARDKKKRRLATLAELRERAADPARVRRYMLYGTLMLCAYIALDVWPFLIPGLTCVFLAVIAKRQHARVKGLFEDEDENS
jgi:hypothetical protein